MTAAVETNSRRRRRFGPILAFIVTGIVGVPLALAGGMFWSASSTILQPPGPGDRGDLSGCRPETRAVWGEDCGRLTDRSDLTKEEVTFDSQNGYALAAWKLTKVDAPPVDSVVLYVPGGGSDRREASRYVDLLLSLGHDLVVIDPVCHGLSPCPVPGLSYGARESRDVQSVVRKLEEDYERVFLMGSSVGAASILIALPEMQGIAGIVAENPMTSFSQLLRDADEAKDMPDWAVDALAALARWRGSFPAEPDALSAVSRANGDVPILFIHSRADTVVPSSHSETLAAAYRSPSRVWLTERGAHGAVWNADAEAYEAQLRDFLASSPVE